ncbi:MAG: hypothetical protein GY743_16620 [Planctomycetaceae bacterium]|nr:hypothetical protein [Planctomycetaceae bacterium]
MLLVAGCGSEKVIDTEQQVIDTEQNVIDTEQLVERNGIYYEVNSEVGFTGRVVGTHMNGQKEREGNYKDGKEVGKRTEWYENGQKKEESTWKDGKEIESTTWDENGREK